MRYVHTLHRMIEERLHCICSQFKDKPNSRKEMVVVPFDLLSKLVDTILENCDKEMLLIGDLVNQ